MNVKTILNLTKKKYFIKILISLNCKLIEIIINNVYEISKVDVLPVGRVTIVYFDLNIAT